MSRHIVLGSGNLGLDLAEEIIRRGDTVEIISRSNGFNYPTTLPTARLCSASYVWCTVGAGSVEAAKQDFTRQIDLHLRLPVELAQKLPEDVTLICFSSDYVSEIAMDPRSLYAHGKRFMEIALDQTRRKKLRVYRVGSLYGVHKPWETFPGKIYASHLKGQVRVNRNPCRPTPTAWLAKELLEDLNNRQHPWTIQMAPGVVTDHYEWSKAILPGEILEESKPDHERPLRLEEVGYGDNRPTWDRLWSEYGPPVMEALKREAPSRLR